MLKKIFTTALLSGTFFSVSFGQIFTVDHNPVSVSTTGTENHDPDPATYADWDMLKLDNHLKNISDASFVYKWQVITPYELPSGWLLQGFCDNIICRVPFKPGEPGVPALWTTGEIQTSMPLAAGERSAFYLQVCAPVDAADGTLTLKVRVWTDGQEDTVVHIVEKGPLGINAISLDDKRVVLSPNPANDRVTVYTDKSLNAEKATVFNMLGRMEKQQAIAKGSESTVIDINALPAGMYMIRITDNKGSVLTSRKLTKQ